MNLPYLSYKQPLLGCLEAGAVNLHVPVKNEAVQFGLPDPDASEVLAVTIESSLELHIAREDGTPLQIEEVFRNTTTGQRYRAEVLARPVGELLLRPGKGERIWSAAHTPGLRVCNTEALGNFLSFISVFALRQQSRSRGEPEMTTAAELLRMFDE